MLMCPGAIDAGLGDSLFWIALTVSLPLAGTAAYPLNRLLIQRGKGLPWCTRRTDNTLGRAQCVVKPIARTGA